MPISTSQDEEIEPLSGKPLFHMFIAKSHVKSPYNMHMPTRFSGMLPSKTTPAILMRGSRTWKMNYFGGHPTHKKLDLGWRAFALDNMLEIGDVCIFELMECEDSLIKFKVQVLRGEFPSVLVDRQEGSCNNPLVIDDD